jgi:hypothetical protein
MEVDRRTRRGVYAFLATFALLGVVHLEWFWPFTGFRLFAELRPAERESWSIVAVDADGTESGVRLDDLPIAYRTTTRVLPRFDAMDQDEREEICAAWVEGRDDVVEVRVYAVVTRLRPDAPPPTRTLAYRCDVGP